MVFKSGIGQDSHRFLEDNNEKKCILAGIAFDNVPGLLANSDGDVVFHAITNAISSLSGTIILGGIADDLCLNHKITDSKVYLQEALKTFKEGTKITHVAITIEAKRPKFKDKLEEMKKSIASALNIDTKQVGITATTGEGLTAFGRGEGIQCFVILSIDEES